MTAVQPTQTVPAVPLERWANQRPGHLDSGTVEVRPGDRIVETLPQVNVVEVMLAKD